MMIDIAQSDTTADKSKRYCSCQEQTVEESMTP